MSGFTIGDIQRNLRARPDRPAPLKSDDEIRPAPAIPVPRKISGLAAPFNELSELITNDGEHYREMITPGAFRESIRVDAITFEISHQADRPRRGVLAPDPLASTADGTLRLFENHRGLCFEFFLQPAHDYLVDLIGEKGNLGASIRFVDEDLEWERCGRYGLIRILNQVKLRHISACRRPAYRGTSIEIN